MQFWHWDGVGGMLDGGSGVKVFPSASFSCLPAPGGRGKNTALCFCLKVYKRTISFTIYCQILSCSSMFAQWNWYEPLLKFSGDA